MAGRKNAKAVVNDTPERDVVGVFNSTQRIITLKGQTKSKKRFKSQLLPKCMNLVPTAYMEIYKRNKLVQIMLDEETLLTGRSANKAEKSQEPKEVKKADNKAAEEAAILSELSADETDGDTSEEDEG